MSCIGYVLCGVEGERLVKRKSCFKIDNIKDAEKGMGIVGARTYTMKIWLRVEGAEGGHFKVIKHITNFCHTHFYLHCQECCTIKVILQNKRVKCISYQRFVKWTQNRAMRYCYHDERETLFLLRAVNRQYTLPSFSSQPVDEISGK